MAGAYSSLESRLLLHGTPRRRSPRAANPPRHSTLLPAPSSLPSLDPTLPSSPPNLVERFCHASSLRWLVHVTNASDVSSFRSTRLGCNLAPPQETSACLTFAVLRPCASEPSSCSFFC